MKDLTPLLNLLALHMLRRHEAHRTEHDLAASNSPRVLLYLDGKQVGRISYNGRAWDINDQNLEPTPPASTSELLPAK